MTALGIDIGGSSVKAACQDSGGGWQTTASERYENPDRDHIQAAINSCVESLGIAEPATVGLCLPGRMSPDRSSIEQSVNLPVLNGWSFKELLGSVPRVSVDRLRIVSDADAAGYDYVTELPIAGRTAAISLGTGVGLCVLDEDQILSIGSNGIGHIGQIDVGRLGDSDRVDPTGATNTLESYIGAPSLQSYRDGNALNLDTLISTDPPMLAIVRALRVVHAIYQPSRIALLGGVGMAFHPYLHTLKELVDNGLTPLACQDWLIESAVSTHHAARGAAKLSTQSD
jgi:predicted NBD/HSP70 family sugar kinase